MNMSGQPLMIMHSHSHQILVIRSSYTIQPSHTLAHHTLKPMQIITYIRRKVSFNENFSFYTLPDKFKSFLSLIAKKGYTHWHSQICVL